VQSLLYALVDNPTSQVVFINISTHKKNKKPSCR